MKTSDVQLNHVIKGLKKSKNRNGASVKRKLSSSTVHTCTGSNTKMMKFSTDTGIFLHTLHVSETENKMYSNVSTCTHKKIENENKSSDNSVIISKRSCMTSLGLGKVTECLKDNTPSVKSSEQRVIEKGSNVATGNNNPEIEISQVSETVSQSLAEISVDGNTCINIEEQNANQSSVSVDGQTHTIVYDLENYKSVFRQLSCLRLPP
ncbi:unnamed protein product [Mytilus coruscus]|uniref:Uncharacterized protein n=1 Tax=Mytilus coruscus TaxID=42192 RepID=A0A6J8CD02_MYTCO|nr:unnamed protein product [Mytilus coruscus]